MASVLLKFQSFATLLIQTMSIL
uniref:Uncharacterized protein n=1 Tax=Rhizophora mucronata TaxID=61149 RepID=A0A2P2QK35_RHIMU